MNVNSIEPLKQSAQQARERAEHMANHSDYPGIGRASYLALAESYENLIRVIEENADAGDTEAANRYEDRKQRRIDRLRFVAAKRSIEASQHWCGSQEVASHIPFGQPILVGHHSERRHRRDLERMRRNDDKAMHAHQESQRLNQAANSAESNHAIYSDDPGAVGKLKIKLAAMETKREYMKNLNAQYRRCKGDVKKMDVSDATRATITAARSGSYNADTFKPVESWELSNLGAEIRRCKKRIEDVEKLQSTPERPERCIGDIRVCDNLEYQKTELYFPGKPSDDVRTFLKQHGFRWVRTVGCWSRGRNDATEWKIEALAKKLDREIVSTNGEIER